MSRTMLYRCPGPHQLHGGNYDYVIVADDDIAATLKAGWFLTTPEAKEAHEKSLAHVEDAPSPRADLEARAQKLGVKFDGRTSDEKLAERVAAAEK